MLSTHARSPFHPGVYTYRRAELPIEVADSELNVYIKQIVDTACAYTNVCMYVHACRKTMTSS